jgi:hypothetical protein
MDNHANETGEGKWDFELINMYESVAFVLFKDGIDKPSSVATSAALYPASAPPLRGHITRGANGSTILVTWNSNSSTSGATAKWGVTSGSYTYTAAAVSATYSKGMPIEYILPQCVLILIHVCLQRICAVLQQTHRAGSVPITGTLRRCTP